MKYNLHNKTSPSIQLEHLQTLLRRGTKIRFGPTQMCSEQETRVDYTFCSLPTSNQMLLVCSVSYHHTLRMWPAVPFLPNPETTCFLNQEGDSDRQKGKCLLQQPTSMSLPSVSFLQKNQELYLIIRVYVAYIQIYVNVHRSRRIFAVTSEGPSTWVSETFASII